MYIVKIKYVYREDKISCKYRTLFIYGNEHLNLRIIYKTITVQLSEYFRALNLSLCTVFLLVNNNHLPTAQSCNRLVVFQLSINTIKCKQNTTLSKQFHNLIEEKLKIPKQIVERGKIKTHDTYEHERSLSWLTTDTSIISGGVKLSLLAQTSHLNAMMRSC
jgi:hypothetical protein